MKLHINVTPLYGAQSDDHAISTLLSIDGLNILLDCGWNSFFDPKFLSNLSEIAPTVHAILLSHSDIPHLGALPYATSKLGLKAPVFATLPVWRMGQMFMYDAYISQDAQHAFNLFDLDDVDAAFDNYGGTATNKDPRFTLLKYQQSFALIDIVKDVDENGKSLSSDVIITPYRAGHLLGGTVWNITKGSANIVYAVHVNHRKDRHLTPTTIATDFSRPSHLILSSTNALVKPDGSATGEEILINTIKRIAKRANKNNNNNVGNILIPIDTAGRVIELGVQLDNILEHDKLFKETNRNIHIVIFQSLSTRTFDFARSMIEWSSDEFMTEFDVSRKNMFQFKHIRLIQDLSALDSLITSSNNNNIPMVILASSLSIETGPARTIFTRWANNPNNVVVLVDRPEPNTLYAKLYEHAKMMSKNDLDLDLVMGKKVPLEGEELEEWREKERTRKRLEAEQLHREEEEARKKEEELKREEEETARRERGEPDPSVENGESVIGNGVTVVDNEDDTKMENVKNGIENGIDTQEENSEKVSREYEEMVLNRFREMGVIPKKQSDIFEYEGEEKKMLIEWDEYGEKVETLKYIIGEDPGEGGVYELDTERSIKQNVIKDDDSENNIEQQEIIPMKHVSETIKVNAKCELVIADCSGISDGDSLRHLVKEVEPRHVTIIGGTKEETEMLGQLLKKALSLNSIIVMPEILEHIDMITEVSVYKVSLDDALVQTVSWEDIGMATRIGFVDGQMGNEQDSKGMGILSKNMNNREDGDIIKYEDEQMDEMDIDIRFDENENENESQTTSKIEKNEDGKLVEQGHGTYFVGTVMLNKLKDRIAEAGLKAEFAGGALCVENSKNGAVVLVKKIGGQHISLQGSLCEEYFTVQDLLYKQVVIPR